MFLLLKQLHQLLTGCLLTIIGLGLVAMLVQCANANEPLEDQTLTDYRFQCAGDIVDIYGGYYQPELQPLSPTADALRIIDCVLTKEYTDPHTRHTWRPVWTTEISGPPDPLSYYRFRWTCVKAVIKDFDLASDSQCAAAEGIVDYILTGKYYDVESDTFWHLAWRDQDYN